MLLVYEAIGHWKPRPDALHLPPMKKIIIRVLKALGLYQFFLKQKRAADQRKFEKQEKMNAAKRAPFYSSFLSAGDLVFDVGANIGNRVEVFLEIGCKVVAVEPQQDCIATLQNKFGSRITIVDKGLGEREEEKTLYIADTNTISSLAEDWIESVKESRFKNHQWNKTAQIRLTTMDKLVAQFGVPAFCKIDVEGYELQVLKGLTKAIPHISLEYTVPEQSTRLLECIDYCYRLSPSCTFNYAVGENMEMVLPQYCSYKEFKQLVAGKKFIDSGFGDIYIKM
jgi:FkbM family methyltransferase